VIDSLGSQANTINHAKTQKGRDAPYCVQLWGSLGMETSDY